ncbi:FTR1 family protein [Clostridium sp. DJ247]|uniref:FTR1 family protein n=1 Tax=Clostridium sp. DJ247 TaxID=2726188 RepID=UPI00162AF1D2|nr:FTR1 family protein [Clostridium sp. DJ247]MBC2582193.1 hypothetical protein [Clostridium sp. DJ247]
MITTGIIAFREGFEILLVIVLMLLYLSKINRPDLRKVVYYGIVSGSILSIAYNVVMFNENKSMNMILQQIFQGVVMLLLSGLALSNVVLLRKQNKESYLGIYRTLDIITIFNLFIFVFLIIFKENLRSSILRSVFINNSLDSTYISVLLGILSASIIMFLVCKIVMMLNINVIFYTLAIILILIGSRLFGEGLLGLFSCM